MKDYYVYILANWTDDVLYIGMTNDLPRRLWEHKNHAVKGFTNKYNVEKIVYFEQCSEVNVAIEREKQLKRWRRDKKVELIERMNPQWDDLSERW